MLLPRYKRPALSFKHNIGLSSCFVIIESKLKTNYAHWKYLALISAVMELKERL